jgi:glycosyltransferase involved in cell wall biosynthesis
MALKIGYLTDERFPSIHTDVQQVVKTIDALGAEGCDVDLIHPRLASTFLDSPAQRKRKLCEYFNVQGNFNDRDILLWPGSDLRIEKLPHGLVGPLVTRLRDYDYIHTRNLLPLTIATRLGQPVLFETYKPLPLTEPWAWIVVQQALKSPYFLGLGVHSDYTRGVMLDHGVDPARVRVIRNGFDPADLETSLTRDAARKQLDLPLDRQLAVYTGQIRPEKGIFSLVDLAQDRPDWTILLVGGPPKDVAVVRDEVDARGLKNMVVRGQVPVSQVSAYLTAADILLLPLSSAGLLRAGSSTVLPMKVYSYLAGGRPILAPDLPDTAQLLIHEHNCLRVEPNNRIAAAASLARLGKDKDLAARLAVTALGDSKQHTWRARAKRIMDFVNQRLDHLPNGTRRRSIFGLK